MAQQKGVAARVSGGEVTARQKERAVFISLCFGLFTFFPETVAVILGNSVAFLADYLRTTSETLSVFLSWLTVRQAARGRLAEGSLAYRRLERRAGRAVAGAMVLSCGAVLYSALYRFRHPAPVGRVGLGLFLSFAAAVINVVLWQRHYRLARRTTSPVLESQWRLFRAKTAINLTVILSVGPSWLLRLFPWAIYLDLAGSLVLAGFLLASARQIVLAARE